MELQEQCSIPTMTSRLLLPEEKVVPHLRWIGATAGSAYVADCKKNINNNHVCRIRNGSHPVPYLAPDLIPQL